MIVSLRYIWKEYDKDVTITIRYVVNTHVYIHMQQAYFNQVEFKTCMTYTIHQNMLCVFLCFQHSNSNVVYGD